MNNKGFIATSLIYSFFLIFITLFLTIIADYLQNKVLLNTIEAGIKDNINNTKSLEDFKIGDIVTINLTSGSNIYGVANNTSWIVAGIMFDNITTSDDDSKLILYNLEPESSISNFVTASTIKSDLELSGDYNDTRVAELILSASENYKLPGTKDGEKIISKNCSKTEIDDSTNDKKIIIDNNECTTEPSSTLYRKRYEILDWNNKKVMVNPDDKSGITIIGEA